MTWFQSRLYAFPVIFWIVTFVFCVGSFWLLGSIKAGVRAEALANIREETDLVRRILYPMLEKGDYDKARDFCNTFNRNTLRITLISNEGIVEADSVNLVKEPGNHLDRDEVRYALAGKSQMATRRSETTGLWMTYYAITIPLDGDLFILRTAVSADQTTRLLMLARSIYWLAVIFSVSIAVLISWNVHRRIHQPLRELQKCMHDISGGKLDVSIDVPQKGVVRPIAILVRKMTEQLKGQILELRRLEDLRRDFLANVSHELKTPMTSILVAAETLQDMKDVSDDMREKLLGMIYSQTQRLSNLVQDILTLASLEDNQDEQQGQFIPVRLAEVAACAANELSAAAEQKGCAIHIDGTAEELQVLGDNQLLIQAIGNILANAVKYSGSQNIEICLRRNGNKAEIACIDHGCGIPREHWDRLFERFYRINKERSRKLGGTGLGLAIVKHVIRLHRGTVTVNDTPGGGATFIVELPLC